MKKKVVITEKIHPDAMAMFAEREDIDVVLLPDVDPETIRREIADADAVLVRAAAIGQDVLEGASRLQVVSRHGVGCDKIATEYLGRRGVPVAIAAQANAGSVAEHVIMMMMVLNKQIFAYDPMTRRRDWAARGTPRTSELFGRTVLIVGFGRIGRRLAPICKAFGMRVVVTDIALDADLAASMGVESAVDFRPYLGEADYLTVHVPLKADTNPLIGAAELAALPPHAYVINCACGASSTSRRWPPRFARGVSREPGPTSSSTSRRDPTTR
ncbi:MAG: NAD(P)-dependent oxidoreductase [Burkholderiaceae bacterium]